MPDHLGARSARIASMSGDQGRAGAQITHAAGFAWAAKIKREDVVTLVYFDERAPEGGEFHNGANFAGVFKAPLVLFCRNADPSISIAEKGVAYALPAVRCDGGDLFAVYMVTKEAVQTARSGGGPTLIEALTPRTFASGQNAQSGQNGQNDKRRDPIARLRRHLDARGLWSDAKQRELEAQLEAEIAAALGAAETLGPPAPATLFDDVYASPPRHLEEQRSELARVAPRAK